MPDIVLGSEREVKGILTAISLQAKRERRRVGLGVTTINSQLLASIEDAKTFADIVVFGTTLRGFESVETGGEETATKSLIDSVANRSVDAIVRGQLHYAQYHNAIRAKFGFTRDLMSPTLIKDTCQNEWFLTPAAYHDDATVGGRCYLATQTARIVQSLGVEPIIGVLAVDSEHGYSAAVDDSLRDGDEIVQILRAAGFNRCDLFPLRIEKAASECNILVIMDGIVGNFVRRALTYLGGGGMIGGFGLTKQFVSIETSRSTDGFEPAIQAAVAMFNVGGMPVQEYPDFAEPADFSVCDA